MASYPWMCNQSDWLPDHVCRTCQEPGCARKFGKRRLCRRHHCRGCGAIFCSKHASKRADVAVRVCQDCYKQHVRLPQEKREAEVRIAALEGELAFLRPLPNRAFNPHAGPAQGKLEEIAQLRKRCAQIDRTILAKQQAALKRRELEGTLDSKMGEARLLHQMQRDDLTAKRRMGEAADIYGGVRQVDLLPEASRLQHAEHAAHAHRAQNSAVLAAVLGPSVVGSPFEGR